MARDLSHYLIGVTQAAEPNIKLVIREAIEATGTVWLEATVSAIKLHPQMERLSYFSQTHMTRELEGLEGTGADPISKVELSPSTREEAIPIVHGIFDRMEAFNDELLRRMEGSPSDEEFLRGKVSESGVPGVKSA